MVRIEYDAGHHFLVAHRIRLGDHRHLRNRGMLGERGFDFERGDILAGAANDVLAPVEEMERSVRSAAHAISSMEPAVAPRLIGGHDVFQIAGEEAATRSAAALSYQ